MKNKNNNKKLLLPFLSTIIVFFFLYLFSLDVMAQAPKEFGDLIIKLLCLLYLIFPAILTLIFILGGFFILTGEEEGKRTRGKKLIVSGVIAFLILIFLTYLVTLTSPDLNFEDFGTCFVGGEPPEYPVTTTLPTKMEPWADARVGLSPTPPPILKEISTCPGGDVYFDASKSIDFDGSIVSYEWVFSDGTVGNGVSVFHKFSDNGTYIVQLTVTDNDGLSDTDMVKVHVRPLEAHILNPKDKEGFLYEPDEEINFTGEGVYGCPCSPPQGYTYRWEANTTGFLSDKASFVIKQKDLGLGQHLITLTVEDCVGNKASDNITIYLTNLIAEIIKPKNDNEILSCPAEFEGNVTGYSPPYQVKWSAEGNVFATGTITTASGIHSVSLSTPVPGLDSGTHDIVFEAEDIFGFKASDEKKNIEVKQCFEIFDLVFVPMGFQESQFGNFKSIAENALNYFLSKAPFKDCPNPDARVKAYYIHPKDCPNTQSGCSNHCGDCIIKARQCVLSNSSLAAIYDKFAAVTIGGGWFGGCACGIPCDGESTSSGWYQVHAHELGHTLGLGHVSCGVGCHACMFNNPNCPDCSLPMSEKRTCIMSYCFGTWTRYCPAGYNYLKTGSLVDYVKGC